MSKITAGSLTIGIGVVHQAVGVGFGRHALAAIARDGIIGAVEANHERAVVFWFLFFGFVLILFGASLHAHERAGTAPRSLGFGLLALSLAGGLAIPTSGFWLALVPAAMVIFAAPKPREGRSLSEPTRAASST